MAKQSSRRRRAEPAGYGFLTVGQTPRILGVSPSTLRPWENVGLDGSYSHQGEEFIYMLSGTLEVWLDELHCLVLQAGDSFWFESTHGHRGFNPGEIEAALLWINTPPTF